jgi:hypothetical protein
MNQLINVIRLRNKCVNARSEDPPTTTQVALPFGYRMRRRSAIGVSEAVGAWPPAGVLPGRPTSRQPEEDSGWTNLVQNISPETGRAIGCAIPEPNLASFCQVPHLTTPSLPDSRTRTIIDGKMKS